MEVQMIIIRLPRTCCFIAVIQSQHRMCLSALPPVIYYTSDVLVLNLTGVVDLASVKVIQEGHHQTLTQVDLHQGHGHILPALNRGYLLQHGQSTAVLHLVRWSLRSGKDLFSYWSIDLMSDEMRLKLTSVGEMTDSTRRWMRGW